MLLNVNFVKELVYHATALEKINVILVKEIIIGIPINVFLIVLMELLLPLIKIRILLNVLNVLVVVKLVLKHQILV